MGFCRFLRFVKFVVRFLGGFLRRGVWLWLRRSQGSRVFLEKLAHYVHFLFKSVSSLERRPSLRH